MKNLLAILILIPGLLIGGILPKDISNSQLLLSKEKIKSQTITKYKFENDTLTTFVYLVDSSCYDPKGRIYAYLEYWDYGKVRNDIKYTYNEIDSLQSIAIFKDEEFPYAFTVFQYILENERLIEKKVLTADASVEERFIYNYNAKNLLDNILVYDEAGVPKSFINYTYSGNKLIRKSTLDMVHKPVSSEYYSEDSSKKMIIEEFKDRENNTLKTINKFFDDNFRLIAMEIIPANVEESIKYSIEYTQNELISFVVITDYQGKKLNKIVYKYYFE